MFTLERVEKRNQEFFAGGCCEKEAHEREKFCVQLRKKRRSLFFMKRRMKGTDFREENEEFRKDPKGFIREAVKKALECLDDEDCVLVKLDQLLKVFTKKSRVVDFWENGTFDLCLSVITTKTSIKLLIKTTNLLANLSVCDENITNSMLNSELIPICFTFLSLHNFEITDNILWCFNNLAMYNKPLCLLLASSQIFSSLLNLATFPQILKTTKLLSLFVSISTHIIHSESHSVALIRIFVNSLQNGETVLPSIMGLDALSTNSPQNVKKILENSPELIEKILKLTGNEEKMIVLHSLRLLANFVYSEDYIGSLLDHGILSFIKKMLRTCNDSHKKEAFFILSNLLVCEAQYLNVITNDTELLFEIIKEMNRCCFDVRFEKWTCIRVLVSKVSNFSIEFLQALVCNISLGLSSEVDPKILNLILEIYESLLRNTAGSLNVKDLLESSQCFQNLSEKIDHGNRNVAEKVLSIIDEFYDKYEIRGSAPENLEFY